MTPPSRAVPDGSPSATAAAGRFVGHAVERREDPRLLSGQGTYIDDVVVHGMGHACFVRSPSARGRITRLDVGEARRAPGVQGLFTAADVAGHWHEMWGTLFGPDAPAPPARLLADGDVRFVGDPVAVVVADSRYAAEDACDLVRLDIEELPPVIDYESAGNDATRLVHPELGTNVAGTIPAMGLAADDPSLEALFASAPHVFIETFRQHRYINVPMETRGIVARWDAHARELDIWSATQNPSEMRSVLSRLLAIPEHRIRVVMKDVGGAFGQKAFVSRDEMCVVLAAVLLGSPVKWIEDRRENLIAANHARAEQTTVRMAFDASGTILGASVDHLEDVGAFPTGGNGSVGGLVGLMFPGPYRIAHYGFSNRAVYTNTCGRAPYRGPWQMESVAREMMMDLAARGLGIDPLELRRRNVIQAEDLPYTTATGLVYDEVSPADTLDQAAAMIGYDEVRRSQAATGDGDRRIGLGMALYVEPSGMASGAMSTEAATIRIDPSGKVSVAVGCASHGQSLETTIPQVVADTLGVDIDDVVLLQGDTAVVPFGGGTGGSRSAVLYGGAAIEASRKVRDKVLRIAAHAMEAAPEDLVIEHGVVSVAGVPSVTMSMADIAQLAYVAVGSLPPELEPGLEAAARFAPPPFTFSNAAHAATCEVDPATGRTQVLRYVVSEDCGVVINPMVVHGQIAGGVVQGLGGVLYEHAVYDDHGNPLTATLLDYLLPSATEVPIIEYGHVETRASGNPGGFKGMGEGGAIGSPPALINAVADALWPAGAKVTDQPLGPQQVFELLHPA